MYLYESKSVWRYISSYETHNFLHNEQAKYLEAKSNVIKKGLCERSNYDYSLNNNHSY